MANQESLFFVRGVGGAWISNLDPFLTGQPACEPRFSDALAMWSEATATADEWLEKADDEALKNPLQFS